MSRRRPKGGGEKGSGAAEYSGPQLDCAIRRRRAVGGRCASSGLDNVALRRIQAELEEDDEILNDRAERAQEPGQRVEEVFSVLGVGNQAGAVSEVARQRQQEEEQCEAYTRVLLVTASINGYCDQLTYLRTTSRGSSS